MRSAAIFVRVAESGSFSSAANTLRMSASGVSKALSRLEARLAIRLLHRTTRTSARPDEGIVYFERCRSLITALEEAEAEIASRTSEPRGSIRVQLPRGFGRRIILPALRPFPDKFNQLSIDVRLTVASSICRRRFDVALRFGRPPDSLAVRFPGVHQGQWAAYQHQGILRTPAHHYVMPETGKSRTWKLSEGTRPSSWRHRERSCWNDIHAVVEAAAHGLGDRLYP
jgi:LysR family transcriptional regulator, regulator for bpeEF and oprC